MIKKFIPAGTPGTFRPEWGQFPEPLTIIDAWLCQGGLVSRHQGWFMKDGKLNKSVYAWQYAPVAPPVDGLEAFKAEWNGYSGISFLRGDYFYNTRLKQLKYKLIAIGEFPTLAAAQKAAYAHFLQSLNDPTK